MPPISDELRYQIMKNLQQNPAMTQRELAEIMGISLGKANYCLKALVEKGWVKVGNFRRSQYKLGYAYLLTPRGLEEKTRVTVAFLKRKQHEYDSLKQELELLQREVAQQGLEK